MEMIVRWITRDADAVAAIRKRFNMPNHTTLNGLTPVDIRDEDMEVFEECAQRGFFAVIRQKWCKNGGQNISPSRK